MNNLQILLLALSVAISLLIFMVVEFSFLLPGAKGLPVLMYHKVEDGLKEDDLLISTLKLRKQFTCLLKKRYTPIHLSDLLNFNLYQVALPNKPILITFDDAYKNNLTHLYPLLEEYDMKANIFLIAQFASGEKHTDGVNDYLSPDDIKKMKPGIVEFGLHSYDHKDYAKLTEQEIEDDIQKSKSLLDAAGIVYQPCLAYPYGSYPKKDMVKQRILLEVLKRNKIQLAFKIGNRYNQLPLENPLLVKRIDIRGTDSMFRFKAKLRTGRSKLFS